MISKVKAIQLSHDWHNGQWSSLYQFASSEIFEVSNILRYLKEIQECIETEYHLYPSTLSKKDSKNLNNLKLWFEYKAQELAITIEWHKHNIYGYLIPYIKTNNSKAIINNLHLAI